MSAGMLTMSPHAQQRRKMMGITEHQIATAVADPELTYPSPPDYPPGRMLYQRGEIVVVMEGSRVITVLWHRRTGR